MSLETTLNNQQFHGLKSKLVIDKPYAEKEILDILSEQKISIEPRKAMLGFKKVGPLEVKYVAEVGPLKHTYSFTKIEGQLGHYVVKCDSKNPYN